MGRLLHILWRLLRGLLLGVVWTVVVVAVLLLATVQTLQLPGGRALVRQGVLSATAGVLPGLSFEALEGDYLSELTLHRVELRDRHGGRAIRAERVTLRLDLWALLRQRLRVEALVVERPELWLQQTKGGKLNLAELVTPSDEPEAEEPPGEPTPYRLALGQVRLVGARVHLHTDPKNPIDVAGLNLELSGELGLSASTVQLEHISLRAAGLPEPVGRLDALLEGRVGLRGERIAARLKLRALALTPRRALGLDLQVKGPQERLELRLGLALPGEGSLDLSGHLGLASGGLGGYQLTLRGQKLNPRAVMPKLPAANLGLTLTLAGQGTPLQPGSRATVTLQSDGGKLDAYRLGPLHLEAGLKEKRWTLGSLSLAAHGVSLGASGSGDLSSFKARVKLHAPSLARLPLNKVLPAGPRPSGAVFVEAKASGPFAGPYAADALVRLQEVAVASLSLARATLKARLSGLPTAPRGRVELSAEELSPDPKQPELTLQTVALTLSGQPRALDLDLAARGKAVEAALQTRVDLPPDLGRIRADLSALRLRYQQRRLRLLNRPGVTVEPGPMRVTLAESRWRVLGGTLTLAGTYRQKGFPRAALRLSAEGLRPPKLPPVSGQLQATVGRRAAALTLEATVAPRQGDSTQTPSTLSVSGRLPLRHGKGPLPRPRMDRPLALTLRAEKLDLALARFASPELKTLSGRLSLALDGAGTLRDPEGTLALTLADAGLRQHREVGARVELTVEGSRTRLNTTVTHKKDRRLLSLGGEVPLSAGALIRQRGNLQRLTRTPIELKLEVPATELERLAEVVPQLRGTAEGTVSAEVSLSGSAAEPRLLARVTARGLSAGAMSPADLGLTLGLSGTADKVAATLAATLGGKVLADLSGEVGAGALALARAPEKKRLRLPLKAELRLPRTALSSLPLPEEQKELLRGTLQSAATVEGTLGKPRAQLSLNLAGARYGRMPVGDLDLSGRFAADKLSATLKLQQPKAGTLDAKLALALGQAPTIQARLASGGLDLAFLQHLSPALREMGGTLKLALSADGPLTRPKLAGTVELDKGRVQPRGMGLLEDLNLGLELTPEQVKLTHLRVTSGDGKLFAHGSLALEDLRPGAFHLDARADDYRLGFGAVASSTYSGKVALKGALNKNTLDAAVTLEDTVLRMQELQSEHKTFSTAPLPDVVYIDEKSDKGVLEGGGGGAPGLDLHVTADAETVFVRGDELDVEAYARLRARTNDKGQVLLKGEAGIRRGWIKVLDNKYEVQRGTVLFSDEPKPDPALDVLVSRRFNDVTVYIALRGTASQPELELRSDPPIYARSQIVNMILTGHASMREAGGGDQGMAVATALSQAIIGRFTRKVLPKVGIDVARVSLGEQQDESGESSLRAEAELGKYITDRIYLGYRRIFGAQEDENQNEALVEYAISARWLLTAVFGDAGVGGVDLFWTYRY